MFDKKFLIDAGERVLATFVQGFLATLVITGSGDTEALKAATIGGIAAALSVAKVVAAQLATAKDEA